jgi:acetyl esterase
MKTLRTIVVAVVTACLVPWTSLWAAESLTYKKVGERELKLFIEKPADWNASDKRPAIVFFFGGGWVGGSTQQFEKQSEYLAKRGLVGIRLEYRGPKGEKGPPVICCQDAKSAMRYVRSHSAELGIDSQCIAAAGGSAGGHLAAFTALTPGLDDPQDAGHGFFNRDPHFTLTLIEADKFLGSPGWIQGQPTL